MRPPVGDRKLHAFGFAERVIRNEYGGSGYTTVGPIQDAWFDRADMSDETAREIYAVRRPDCYLLRSPYVCQSDRYPRQALRRGWTRISEVKR